MKDYKNWKTALSCKIFDAQAFDEYRKNGIELVEISPALKDYEHVDWEDIKRQSDRTGVGIWSLHLPFSRDLSIAHKDAQKRRDTVSMQLGYLEKAAKLGAHTAVIHPSSEPIEPHDRFECLKFCTESLYVLSDRAESLGLTLAVENLPRSCLCRDSDEMREVLDSDKRLRFCFDVNHLLCDSHEAFIEKFSDRLVTIHISDYDFKDERHALPGTGLIDWKRLVELLENADYSGPFLYEVSLAGKETGEFTFPPINISQIHKNHAQIKTFTGHGKRL